MLNHVRLLLNSSLHISMNMKGKIMLLSAGVFLPTLLLASLFFLCGLWRSLVLASAHQALTSSYAAQTYVDRALDMDKNFSSRGVFIVFGLAQQEDCRVQAYDVQGNLLADSLRDEPALWDEDIAQAAAGVKAWTLRDMAGTSLLLFSFPVYAQGEIQGTLRFMRPLTEESHLMHRMAVTLILAILVSSITAYFLAGALAEVLVRPLAKLKHAATRIAAGNYEEQMQVQSGDEIESLAVDFECMRKSVQRAIQSLEAEQQKQKLFFDSVTHELKTPLTAIIGYAEILPRTQKPQDYQKGLAAIYKEGRRLLNLVEELLTLSRLGRPGFAVQLQSAPLKPLILEVVEEVRPRLLAQDIHLELLLEDSIAYFDHDKTKQILLNLFDNAIRHSECLTLEILLAGTTLHILDDGLGMEQETVRALLDPWRHFDVIQHAKGNGLGLAICYEIMRKQGGHLQIYSELNGGTEVVLCFAEE